MGVLRPWVLLLKTVPLVSHGPGPPVRAQPSPLRISCFSDGHKPPCLLPRGLRDVTDLACACSVAEKSGCPVPRSTLYSPAGRVRPLGPSSSSRPTAFLSSVIQTCHSRECCTPARCGQGHRLPSHPAANGRHAAAFPVPCSHSARSARPHQLFPLHSTPAHSGRQIRMTAAQA